jgi:intracellular sulfur oxidation DsrE/DsrF family protein
MNKTMNEPVSREHINAYVDGELAAEERNHLMDRMAGDAGLRADVCAQRTLKEQVRAAYGDLPLPKAGATRNFASPAWRQALAAGLLLSLGLSAGWLAHDRLNQAPVVDRLAGLPPGYQPVALSGRVDTRRVLLHLDSSTPERLSSSLDVAEQLVKSRGQGQVELLVNSLGIDLLRQDRSPERARIARLAERYPNLAFVVCGQTVARLMREGEQVALLPQARVASSAINEITSRMQQGWVYVKM